MKCLVLRSFAGIVYSGARGATIDLPEEEARGQAWHGNVEIIEEPTFEIPEVNQKQTRIIKPKRNGL